MEVLFAIWAFEKVVIKLAHHQISTLFSHGLLKKFGFTAVLWYMQCAAPGPCCLHAAFDKC